MHFSDIRCNRAGMFLCRSAPVVILKANVCISNWERSFSMISRRRLGDATERARSFPLCRDEGAREGDKLSFAFVGRPGLESLPGWHPQPVFLLLLTVIYFDLYRCFPRASSASQHGGTNVALASPLLLFSDGML